MSNAFTVKPDIVLELFEISNAEYRSPSIIIPYQKDALVEVKPTCKTQYVDEASYKTSNTRKTQNLLPNP